MGDTFQSVTIKDGEEVTSNINPAGDSLPGKVVPLEKPYEATTDRIQISNSGEGDFYDSTRNVDAERVYDDQQHVATPVRRFDALLS